MNHQITLLAVPGTQLLDVSGPLDVFAEANRVLNRTVYHLRVMSLDSATVQCSSGVRLLADMMLADQHQPHTFLIAGAPDAMKLALTATQIEQVIQLCQGSQRYGSVCTGALLLAQTGLLRGKKVTTHWACAAALAEQIPDAHVEADALYVADGKLRTAAGVTSGLDMALRLVEEDLGRELAQDIAANLVMFFQRPVTQGHFARKRQVSLAGRSTFQEMQRWALANLAQINGLHDMAAHMQISARHLARLFRQEMDVQAGSWLENARIEHARSLLEQGTLPLKAIPAACGYHSADVLRRAFVKVTGMTPSMYRKMFTR
ncbi:AraC family transcriptional regulator [Pantoea rodasii]|uniref:AraC family transcriptional regulator n=1 Tax=Pantoea rodasii TaxID=1076549 RepID=A0A2M9W6W7_9GAMM|nr:helix-turn-helix domain-containing protein [Pantoea rodasii]PJZ03280.1 AraC family transcriptional regulator [Pantoea rodasii]